MADENMKKASTEPTEVKRAMRQGRRATMPSWIPDEGSEPLSPSSRRKLSADSANRSLFPRTIRSSCDDVLPADSWTSTTVEQPVKLKMGERTLGQKPITIMSVLRLNVEKYPDRQAYAYKTGETWDYINFKELFELIKRAAKGFISFGLQRFYGVAIMGRNAPEWAIANFATIYAGGIVVPISPTLEADECIDILKNTRCSILVVGSTKKLEAFLQIRSKLINVKAIIKYGKDTDQTSTHVHTWDQLLALGDKVEDERLQERITFQAPNLCCTILHTPGTTGPPKPVMLSQDNLVWTARTMGRRMSCSVASGIAISIIALCHVSGLVFDLYTPMVFASTVYFISSTSIFEWTKEVKPTMILAPYLVFEELRVRMTSHLTRSCFSRIIYWWAKSIGISRYRATINRRSMPMCWSLANSLVYEKLRTALGLQSSREIFFSGRVVSEQAIEFFTSLNIPVLGIYGMAECAGPITVSAMPEMYRIASVGKEIDGVSTKIMRQNKDGVGDILIRGRNIFMGYLNQPEMTKQVFDKDDWFITGDQVRRDKDGFLYVSGRIAELLTLGNGEAIAPEPIESILREELPVIRNCMVVGKGRAYVAALLAIKTEVNWQTFEVSNTLTQDSREWFQKLGYNEESIDKFLQNPDKRITNNIQAAIDRVNAHLQPSHRIHKWTILPRDFTVKSGEINWSLRLRRFVVEEKYAETINSLYIQKT